MGDLPQPQCQGLPRWVHRDLPRTRSARLARGRAAGARVPPMHYLDKPSRYRVSRQPCQTGVQFSLSKGVHFRTSLDNCS
jgi:hypothetical protein